MLPLPDLPIAGQIALLLVAMVFLWKGADWFVDGAVHVAHHFKLPDLLIGLTLVGFGTSAPEFAVSIGAALAGKSDMSVGNVAGSNAFNLGLILGICCVIRAIPTTKKLVYRDGLVLCVSALFITIFMMDRQLSRIEGGLLFVALLTYILVLFLRRDAPEALEDHQSFTWLDIPRILVGLSMIVFGAEFLVHSASGLARVAGLSEWAIAVTIVAAGTSAPELVTSVNATLKGRAGITVGNLIGSDLFNMLGVLGLAALISPLTIASTAVPGIWMLAANVLLVFVLMRTGWQITRLQGILLILVNLLRWYIDIQGSAIS